MSELLNALKDVEKLESKVDDLYKENEKLRRENYILRDDISKHYPFFMAIKIDGDVNYRNIIFRGKHNYYHDCRCSFSELKDMVFHEVYKTLRDIEEQGE
jgi:regulator of replication initiation timing